MFILNYLTPVTYPMPSLLITQYLETKAKLFTDACSFETYWRKGCLKPQWNREESSVLLQTTAKWILTNWIMSLWHWTNRHWTNRGCFKFLMENLIELSHLLNLDMERFLPPPFLKKKKKKHFKDDDSHSNVFSLLSYLKSWQKEPLSYIDIY